MEEAILPKLTDLFRFLPKGPEMKVKNNPIANMFRSIADVINSLMTHNIEQQERAVTIGNVWTTVQNHLSEMDTTNESGDYQSGGYVLDVYIDDTGAFAIITHSDGKLYKVPVTIDANSQVIVGEEQLVVVDFKPITARGITIKRQADGRVRWFAMPACTAVLNRSGEIDSRALFDSFVEHIERNGGTYPELDFFHLGERLILGTADWVARDGFSYCASGLFDDTEIGRAAAKAIEADPNYWGLSIAYLPTQEPEKLRSADGIEIPVYNAGINRYISLLPEDTAASILTSISTGEEVNRMDKKIKDALKKLTGDDAALLDNIVAAVDDVNRSATDMINREQTPVTVKVKTVAAPVAATPAPVARELTDEDIQAVLASDQFKTLFDEKLAAAIEARSTQADDEEEGDEEEETLAAETGAEGDDTNRAVLEALTKLTERVNELSKTRNAEVQEVLNDLPARIAKTTIIRPRATRMPDQVNNRQRTINMADVASQTLAAMGEPA